MSGDELFYLRDSGTTAGNLTYTAVCSTNSTELLYPSSTNWNYAPSPPKPPEPTILECEHCGIPFERRDASGKLNRVCYDPVTGEGCGAPLPIKIKKRKKPGNARYELIDLEEIKRQQGFFRRLLGALSIW